MPPRSITERCACRRVCLRGLVILFAAAASFDAPEVVRAQQAKPPRHIGIILNAYQPGERDPQTFRKALQDAGYVEGRDVVLHWRTASGDYQRLPELAGDLVQRNVDVIVVESTPAAQAAVHATTRIPIVMALVADPVGSRLVPNLAHPGGNVTGLSMITADLAVKRLQLLKEAIPRLSRVGVLWNPESLYGAGLVRDLEAVAPSIPIELRVEGVRVPEHFANAFSSFTRAQVHALYVLEDSFVFANRATILKLATKAKLPVMFGERTLTVEGGLISYGPSFSDLWRRSASYVDRILKGAQPGDLPIEQPTRFELIVNQRTARALGITIPESILGRADEVLR